MTLRFHLLSPLQALSNALGHLRNQNREEAKIEPVDSHAEWQRVKGEVLKLTDGNENLESHTVEKHLAVDALFYVGVPIYDIQLAGVLSLDLTGMYQQTLAQFCRSDSELYADMYPVRRALFKKLFLEEVSVEGYRRLLFKTIMCIHENGCMKGDIDWDQIEKHLQGCREIVINSRKDTHDCTFAEKLQSLSDHDFSGFCLKNLNDRQILGMAKNIVENPFLQLEFAHS